MKRVVLLSISVVTLFCLAAQNLQAQNIKPSWTTQNNTQRVFIENKGQFPVIKNYHVDKTNVLYAFDDKQTMIYFRPDGLTYYFHKQYSKEENESNEKISSAEEWKEKEAEERMMESESDVVDLFWENSNPNVEVIAENITPDYFSYSFFDNSGVQKNVNFIKGYRKLVYKNIYPNIDVEYTFHPTDGIKYSLILHPGADLSMVSLKYTGTTELTGSGDIHIKTLFGNIIDHAPLTYYASDKNSTITSSFKNQDGLITFDLGPFDKSKTVIIDPWTQTPSLPTSHAVMECEHDAAGNVYIIGGESPMQLIKYDASGNIQWTYNTPYDTANFWLGTFAVDLAGNSFVTAGSIARLEKINSSGSVDWSWTPSVGSSDEYWNIAFNCDQTKLIVGGTTGTSFPTPVLHGAIFDINTSDGSVNNTQIVGYGSMYSIPMNLQEVRSITSCRNARYYFLTLDTLGCIDQNFSLCPSSSPTIFKTNSTYALSYKCENYRPNNGNGGIMAVRANRYFVYTQNGTTIHKRSLATGAILATAAIPGGLSTTTLGQNQVGNSGIDIDSCGNVYVGSGNAVIKYDANLNILTSVATSYKVYDVSVSTGGNVIACGATGDNSIASRTGYVQSINMSACDPMTLYCCDANICPVSTYCTSDPSINLTAATPGGTWSGTGITNASSGTFDPATAGPGTHTIVYNLPCGSDSVNIIVSSCLNLNACIEMNGDISVSGGIGPYTWEVQHTSLDCSSCPLGNCLPPICSGVIVTTYTSFATGSTVTPLSPTDTIRITDANSNSIIITNISSLPDCPICPAMNITANHTNVNCYGYSTGSITATPPGSALYSYTLINGVGTTVGSFSNVIGAQNFNNLPAGTYNLTIADTGNCDTTFIVVITQPQSITQTYTIQDEVCENSYTGSIIANIAGGSPPFTFIWSNGAITQNQANISNGSYSLTITDVNGCTFDTTLAVAYSIAASFTAVPPTGPPPLAVSFTYTGTAGISYLWAFGDGTATDSTENPVHTYIDPGNYNASLTVFIDSTSSCTVTFTVVVVTPSFLIIPNVFTPNGDGFNDNFIIQNAGLASFSCVIFNRWGKNIYEWSDPSKGWDGKTSAGKAVQDGVYYYIISAKGQDGLDYSEHGTVTLVRH